VVQDEDVDSKKILYRARLLVEEERYDVALQELEATELEGEKQRQDVAYLRGWCYTQRNQWEDAFLVLFPLLQHTDVEQLGASTSQEREHQALAYLLLGLVAVNLAHYEDASHHLTFCLKVLHDRRVHLPVVRIRARYSLALTCVMRGLYATAVQQYDEALRQCRYYHIENEIPHIYYGLCDVYQCKGEYVQAYEAGCMALALYDAADDQYMLARMHNMLGHVCFRQENYPVAAEHYTRSLEMAVRLNGPTMEMLNCAALAELSLAEERLVEARKYCQLALRAMAQTPDVHMRGRVYHVIGKVAYVDACRADEASRQEQFSACVQWYEKAQACLGETQAYMDTAEVYHEWANVLESMGHIAEAIECWRKGYELLHKAKE
jgi:tetratricopeptide (TPR) repeat protein